MPAKEARPGLRRVLGFPSLLFYGVGLILGAGIYSIIGAAAGQAGDGLWLAFLLAAVVALATGLSYAELAAMYPKAGADYVYAKAAFPRWPRLAAATGLMLAASAVATSATVSRAFAGYLALFWSGPWWLAAVGLLAAATLLNIIGMRHSSWTNIALTLVEVAGLALVIAVGWSHPGLADGLGAAPLSGLAAAAGLVFFAFLGFEDIANLAQETRRPERDVPRAILCAIAVSTLLYVAVAAAAVALASPDDLAQSGSPLADAVATVQPRLASVLAGVALFATANTALIALVAASRMLFGIAQGGDAPRLLAMVLPGRGTPWVAAVLAGCAGAALLSVGATHTLGGIASAAALAAFVVVNASLVRLRFTAPEQARPFRVPLRVGRVPLPPLVGIAGAVAFLLYLPPMSILAAAALFVAAALVLLAGRRRKHA